MKNIQTLFLLFFTGFVLAQEPRLVLPVGHTRAVLSAVFSPDGKLVLTASTDKTARIYEVNTGKEIVVLNGHTDAVNSAVFSSDGKLILTSSGDKTVRIWNVDSGKEVKLIKHSNPVNSAVFSPDGKLILSASDDGAVRIFDINSGKKINKIKFQNNPVNSAVFSPDGKLILSASDDGAVRIFDVNTKKLYKIKCHIDRVNSAVFSPDGKLFITASKDGTSNIFEVASGKNLITIDKSSWWGIKSASFSPDGKMFMIAGDSVCIWELITGKEIPFKSKHSCRSANFSPDCKLLLSTDGGLLDFSIRISKISNGDEIQSITGKTKSSMYAILSSDDQLALNSLVLNNETFFDTLIRVWDIEKGNVIQVLGDRKRVVSAVFSPDGKFVLTNGLDSTASIYDLITGKELQVLKGHNEMLNSALYSYDGKLAITASSDNTARIYEVANGKELQVLKGNSAVFSPDGNLVLTFNRENARVYETSTGKELQVLKVQGIETLVFSPDGKYAIFVNAFGEVGIIDIKSGKTLKKIKFHKDKVNTAVFSPDGKLILTSSDDKTARTWELSSGKELQILNGHTDAVNSAVFSSDGKKVLTTGFDHKTILWDASTCKALYTRLQLQNGDWLVYDEHYRYDGSQGARDYLYFVCGLEVVDLAQVKDALYVPNLVQRIMNGENLEHLPKLKDLEICGVTPEVEQLDNKNNGGYYYQIKSRKGGVGQVEIYINGMLRQTLESKTLTQKDGIYELKVDEKLIEQYQLVDKETEIKVIARTADNKISSRGAILEVVTEDKIFRKPDLHAIMVGIDDYKGEGLDLNYAAKDAIDLQTALETSAKKFFNSDDTNRVHFYNLTVNRAGTIGGLTPDRNNILQTIDKIAKNSKPEDVLLLFFAGHGEVNIDKNFMLLTADASREQAPNYTGISMKELLEKLTKVPAGKRVLILDACHSGAAINELNLKDIAGVRDGEDAERQSQRLKELENLASKSGLAIITASSSEQKAMELPQYEHGLMTYALLTTMMNEPMALDKNNNLQLEDWLRETERAVGKLIENQSAQRFVPINFSLGKVDDEVRKSIDLRETPSIMIANVMNRMSDDDDLEIKSILKKLLSDVASRGTDKILLAEKDNEKAFSINISYELIEDKIESRVSIKKNKAIVKKFNYNGLKSNLKDFVNGLGEEILKIVRG